MMMQPGWYPDPAGGPQIRYWDGQKWYPVGVPVKKRWSGGLIAAAIVGVVMFLVGGVVLLLGVLISVNSSDRDSSTVSVPSVTDTITPVPPATAKPTR
ncbi:DUF2510 domain-containing protein [Mycobacterium sp. 20091114027_K0903767]|nr:DUF2510 domain-containing protein [Mycobacterium sp. 20091114027_K0903767]